MCLKWEIEDLSVHMIHSRKLNIKAIVTFYAVVDEMTGIQLPVEISEDGISVKKKKVQLMSLMVHKKDTLRIKDEVTLAPTSLISICFCGTPLRCAGLT